MQIIVGLGNPGEQYKNTRHNAGWLALDNWLGEVKWSENKKFSALLYEDGDYLFVKPLLFMNRSGETVQKILSYYKLRPKNFGLLTKKDADLTDCLAVIHDEMDLAFGNWRLSVDSACAGHRGVQSIIDQLKTKNFRRIRIGVKNELLKNPIPPDKFVLQPFNETERKRLPEIFQAIDIKNLK
jgi:peptidyl-tRNA hydrolase, PTH1 family